jgi:hypothetical protein
MGGDFWFRGAFWCKAGLRSHQGYARVGWEDCRRRTACFLEMPRRVHYPLPLLSRAFSLSVP